VCRSVLAYAGRNNRQPAMERCGAMRGCLLFKIHPQQQVLEAGVVAEGALLRTDHSVNKWLDLKELEALNRA
jgi:hypothetical protein